MSFIYDVLSYPFGWILSLLYNIFNDNYAIALIMFTFLAKLILLPSSISTQKSQAKNLRTRAKLEKIRKKYAGDQARLNEELQTFYQKEGYGSMTAGCGTLLIQFPIIMGLYGAIYKPLSYIIRLDSDTVSTLTNAVTKLGIETKNVRLQEMAVLSHVDEIKAILPNVSQEVFDKIANFNFTAFGYDLGAIPLEVGKTEKAYVIVPIVAFLAAMLNSIYSFIKTKNQNPDAANNATMGCMLLFMPFMSLWLAFQFPVGIGVYWALNSILSFIQIVVLNKIYEPSKVIAKMMVNETNDRRSKEFSKKKELELLSKEN